MIESPHFDLPFDTPFSIVADGMEFGQGNKPKPPTKIRGSQHIRRVEKQLPKKIIRKPVIVKRPS